MTTDSFSWLHLTDFHYGLKGQDCLWPTLRQPFLESLAALYERCGPWDAVLFTGDLV
jgi:3',5'-cyclic AMP phosphodiesterase CpdA